MRHFIAYTYTALLTWEILLPDPLLGLGEFSLLPINLDPSSTPNSLLLHFLSYAIMATLFLWARVEQKNYQRLISLFCCLALHGIITEVLQAFIPHRCPNLLDGLGNLMGIGITFYINSSLWNRTTIRRSV